MPSSSPPKPQGWKLTTYCFEPNNEETFDIAFCKVGKHVQDGLFCTVGGRYISIYLAKPDSTTMVHRFADSNESESYFCCTWLLDAATGDLLVAAAGLKACVKIVNCHTKRLHHHLVGHGNAINDLAGHPLDHDLLFSASKDESIRLWNIRNGRVLAVFGGDLGHRDEVLSVSVHALGNCFLSAGMDHSIKVWALDNDEVKNMIKRKQERNAALTTFQQRPLFSTYRVHSDYVDCASWIGDLILSKSTANEAVLWKPCPERRKDAVTVLRRYALPATDIWFLRFDVDAQEETFVCGNTKGRAYVYDIDSGRLVAEIKLLRRRKSPIRRLAFSKNGSSIVAACSEASVWRWDRAATK